ncbi:unnamed protein product [Strongylus vulgaris]|uniref:Selenocysteine lyase n=1 Tax=Strongylus vulgaris TaxID=40348 RepID=A0A3P7J1X8_STRVU|nr:unnamed protein product [Strongylus vulgaris]
MSWYIEEQEPVYLDYNATTPLDPSVKTAITAGLELWANPASGNPIALKAREEIEKARKSLAELLHVTGDEVIFTSGGTEGNNWVIRSAVEKFKREHPNQTPHIICSAVEHPSILEPLHHLKDNGEIEISVLPIDPKTGQITASDALQLVTPSTCLVTVMLANNETGVLQPISDLSDFVRKASAKHDEQRLCPSKTNFFGIARSIKFDSNAIYSGTTVLLHSDATQAIGKIDVNLAELKVDAITIAGHKFYGPRNGALILRSKYTSDILPWMHGGGQEKKLRSGCKTFYASSGSACHSGAISPVLLACGISKEMAERTVRFSFGRETTNEDVDRVVKELKAMMFLAKHGSSLMNVINAGPVPGF